MVGWWIILSAQTPEERDADNDRKAKNLATWETGVQGLAWVKQLMEKGKMRESALNGGYPNRYIGLASDLLPLFQDGPPLSPGIDVHAYDEFANKDVTVRGDRNWNVTLHPDRIAACPTWKLLTLEIWDQS